MIPAAVATALSALWWAWTLYATVRTIQTLPVLARDTSPPPPSWPRVSLVVPARNEARDLEKGIRTRLDDDYPNLQVVLVNDRSTDATGALADALAARDPRVRVVHVTELPAGWLGKLHAMQRGAEASDGDWILFSDADVEFAPGTLRRAIAHCEHGAYDHMTVVPGFRAQSFALDATLNVFCRELVAGARLWRVSDLTSRAAVGGGMFNLVRRSLWTRTPGLEWLRLEIADDVVLGQMLKQHGARPVVVQAVSAVTLDFYKTLGEMAWGLEKSGFAIIGRYRVSVMLLSCTLGLVAELGWLAGLALPSPAWRALSLAAGAMSLLSVVLLMHWAGRRVIAGLAYPFGLVALVAMVFRSAWLVWRRGGVVWRDTLYRVEELRAHSRLTL